MMENCYHTYIPSIWVKFLWVRVHFRIHMHISKPDLNFPALGYGVTCEENISLVFKLEKAGLSNIRHLLNRAPEQLQSIKTNH